MSEFSKINLNAVEWNGAGDLSVSRPEIAFVDVIGNPNGTIPNKRIYLPSVQNTTRTANVEYPFILTINDANGFFTSAGLIISPSAN